MLINQATFWWIACGVLVAAELLTGTFYLLMLAVGAAAAALSAHSELGFTAQIATAALVGGVAVVLWHGSGERQRRKQPSPQANPDLNLDIGQPVHVEQWDSEGLATVKHRGAAWQARYMGQGAPEPGRFLIRAIEGSCLLLDH